MLSTLEGIMLALRTTLALCVIAYCVAVGAAPEPAPPPATTISAYPAVPGELRGIWMHNYAKPSWQEAMQTLAEANFNAAFPYMMSGGVAFYRSKVLPVHPAVAEEGDFLQAAVAAAKATGVPLHARMLNLTTLFAPAEVRKQLAQQGRLTITSAGKATEWLCPANKQNRQQQVAAALELVAYGVAGIQFDYLRYPWKTSCFCKTCRRQFEHDLGVRARSWPLDAESGCYRGRFADWRREQITSLVAEMSSAVRKANPDLMVSAAVFLNWEGHRETFGQDWRAWVDQGLVDFVVPMNYTTDNEKFTQYVSRQQKWIEGKVPFAAGIGVNSDGHQFPGPELALQQIRIAREHGARGWVIFNYCDKFVLDYLPAFAASVTKEPTVFQGIPAKLQGGRAPVEPQ